MVIGKTAVSTMVRGGGCRMSPQSFLGLTTIVKLFWRFNVKVVSSTFEVFR